MDVHHPQDLRLIPLEQKLAASNIETIEHVGN